MKATPIATTRSEPRGSQARLRHRLLTPAADIGGNRTELMEEAVQNIQHAPRSNRAGTLSQINAEIAAQFYKARMWHYVGTFDEIPTDRDLRLAVINGVMHELVFPCRRRGKSWIDAKTQRPVEVHPTHWQEWPQK